MRKVSLFLLMMLAATLVLVGQAYCVNVDVSAVVPGTTPSISTEVKELTAAGQNPSDGTTVQAMDFGELTHTLVGGGEANVWYSQKYFCVLIYTNGFGNKYEVKSTCSGLSSGGDSLPAGSFGLTPGYSAADRWVGTNATTAQGDQPANSVLGTAGRAIFIDRSIYKSEAAGSNRIIRAFYGLPAYGAGGAEPYSGYQPIPLTQPPGTYTGTVVITIAAY